MMTSSDIIAIVAIVISAIVSIVMAVISYKNNIKNIEAKRSEIAFEKRLEAFRKITEKITNIITGFSFLGGAISIDYKIDKRLRPKLFSIFTKAIAEFNFIYIENRIYLPPHIDLIVKEFGILAISVTESLDEKRNDETVSKNLNKMLHKGNEIILEIQKFVGFH